MLSNCTSIWEYTKSNDTIPTAITSKVSTVSAALPIPRFTLGFIASPGVLGSVFVELGNSKIICSVHGPRQSSKGENIDIGTFECELSFAIHITDDELSSYYPQSERLSTEKHMAQIVQEALQSSIRLECYPKTLITLSVLILQTSSYDLSAIINGASLALADSAVQVLDLVTCGSIIVPNQRSSSSNGIALDTTTSHSVKFTSSYMLSLNYSTYNYVEGRLDVDLFPSLQKAAKMQCSAMKDVMIKTLSNKYNCN